MSNPHNGPMSSFGGATQNRSWSSAHKVSVNLLVWVVLAAATVSVGYLSAASSADVLRGVVCLLAFMGFLAFLLLPRTGTYLILFSVFVPLSFGEFLGVRSLYLYEIVIPIVAFVYFFNKVFMRQSVFAFNPKLNPTIVPILLYFVIILLNYARNPLPPSGMMHIGEELGGMKIYYRFFLCLLLYLLFTEIVATSSHLMNKTMSFIWTLTLAIAVLGVLMIVSGPVNAIVMKMQALNVINAFEWQASPLSYSGFGLNAYRLGLLTDVVPVALFLLTANVVQPKTVMTGLLLLFMLFALVLSGGRAGFASCVLTITIWVLLRKKWVLFVCILVLCLSTYLLIYVHYDKLPDQIKRITFVNAPLSQLDYARDVMYQMSWDLFRKHPVFGVGIGAFPITGVAGSIEHQFLTRHLRYGGHGAYVSLLFLTGMVGLIPFLWVIIRSLRGAYCVFVAHSTDIRKCVSLFLLLSIVFYSALFAFSGRGSELWFFVVTGMVSGLSVYHRNRCRTQ